MISGKNSNKFIGNLGERYVGELLEQKGWKIIQYNYFSSNEEIDIIAVEKQYLVFIEVKTRKEGSLVSGMDAIGFWKRRRIVRCAEHFLSSEAGSSYAWLQPRFDVAEVTLKNSDSFEVLKVDYITNAFDAS